MARTLLIASAAYVEPELEAEFGRLPPAFLPLGNRRLLQHQRAAIGDTADRVIISLPESFELHPVDLALLEQLRVEPVFVPDGLSLGQSIIYVINVTASSNQPFAVLHGDTLLNDLDVSVADAVSVEETPPPGYRWGFASVEGGRARIEPGGGGPGLVALTGFFSFASTSRFVQAVTRRGGDFLAGLADYAEARPMVPLTSSDWLDFGHAGTFHRSRRKVTAEREFNRITATRRSVVKSGTDARKLEAEARWFEAMPPALRLFAPAYLGRTEQAGAFAYELEYLHLPTLADLFVFGRLQQNAWERIFEACDEFLSACASYAAPEPGGAATRTLYLDKTMARLETYARAEGVDLSAPCRLGGRALPSLETMAAAAAAAIPEAEPRHLALAHGDFCFSNILYDTRAGMVRVIDPRGLDAAGRFSQYGDLRYDIAKLYHSAVGLYDHILAGNCRVARHGATDLALELPDQPDLRAIAATFLGSRFSGLAAGEAAAPAIAVLLFFSMLPLHSDDRQRQAALLANGMRLFSDLDRAMGG